MTGDLHYFSADLVGFAVATALALPLLLGAGAVFARLLSWLRPETDWRSLSPALAFAFAPILDALVIRLISVEGAIIVRIVLLALAVTWARRFIPRVGAIAFAGAGAWWLYLAAMYLDVDWGGRLYQSVTALDLVKHAAVVREIGLAGLPLGDPFYARPQGAAYYHYFYDGAALIDRLGGGIVEPRMAFCGAAFACGIAFAAFLRGMVVELGAWAGSERRLTALTLAVCAIGGWDIVGLLVRWRLFGLLERNPEWWDEEISFVPTSATWVPHHLAGVIAAFIALLLLARAVQTGRIRGALLAAAGGLAMASAFGLSIWVTLGASAVVAIALRTVDGKERPMWLAWAALAGVVALAVSALQIADLFAGRPADAGFPLALWIRDPMRLGELTSGPLNPLLALALTPPVLLIEFGALAVGSWLYWRNRELREAGGILGRVLVASAAGALLINLLVRSAIINNDFGWRVAWFAAVPAMIWTIVSLGQPLSTRLRVVMGAALLLGFTTTAYAVIVGRIPASALPPHTLAFINADPEGDLAMRGAYAWANRNLPPRALLQHNPAAAPRALNFGLYGRNPTMVADFEAELFGASERQVHGRAFHFGEIFAGRRPIAQAGQVHLVVSNRDPLWRAIGPADCLYRTGAVCITRTPTP